MNKNEERWYDLNAVDNPYYNIDSNKSIYRIIPFDRLRQMILERTNTLVKINKWDDKYENFILKENYVFKGKNISLKDLSERFYGQCWTTQSSSDAMWRIYSTDTKSVKIKTSMGKLAELLKQNKNGEGKINLVRYYSQPKIEKDLLAIKELKESYLPTLITQSLFVKRISYKHEEECRIIFFAKDDSRITNKQLMKFDIDPLDFIESIQFDPRANLDFVAKCKYELRNICKYPSKKIYKSKLYTFTPLTLSLVK